MFGPMCTIRTKLRQLQDLLDMWTSMTDDMGTSRLTGIMAEMTMQIEIVIDERQLCSEQDLFRIGDIGATLDGSFDTS